MNSGKTLGEILIGIESIPLNLIKKSITDRAKQSLNNKIDRSNYKEYQRLITDITNQVINNIFNTPTANQKQTNHFLSLIR